MSTGGQGSVPGSERNSAAADDGAGQHWGMTVALGLVQLGPAFILVVLMVVLSLLSPYFLTIRNMQNLGAQTAIVCALALGQLLVIVVRGVDVSVGSVIALTVVIVGRLMEAGYENGLLHIATFLLVGACVGAVNGFLIVKGGIPQPLIVTVATLGVVRGMALLISGGQEHIGMSPIVETAGNAVFD